MSHFSHDPSVSTITATEVVDSLKNSLGFQSQTGLLNGIRPLELPFLVDAHEVRGHVSLGFYVRISSKVALDALLFEDCCGFCCNLRK